MTRSASIAFSLGFAIATAVLPAKAQPASPPGSAAPAPGPAPAEPPSPPPDTGAVPRGAAGAGIVAPKEEAAPPPTPVTITPPKLVKDEGALYPEAARKAGIRERVTVFVILDIDATGAVKKATVESPAGNGFDEAATEAAQKLVFEPAKRGDRPVASRIRHRYDFDPPPARFRGTVRSSGTDRPIARGRVTVIAPDGVEKSVDLGPDGRFVFDGLAPGTYRFRVVGEGFTPQEGTQELGPGEEAINTLRVEQAAGMEVGAKPEPDEEDIQEVRVRGVRPPREVTKRSLEQRELNRIPGTSGDALRSLQYLPGVARPPGLAGLLIIRGSAPQDTNVFVDGTLVPLIYHFGGLSSAIPTELLEKIDFYPGNFSAQYGRVMGGVVDVGMRDPKKDKLHGLAQVDLIDARGLVEGPIFDTGWNVAVAGRRSYFDLWLKPVLEEIGAGVSTAPVYYDYQAMVARDIGKDSSIRFAFFGSDDLLRVLVKSPVASDPAIGGGISAHTGFYRFQGRYKAKLGKDTDFRLMAAVGSDYVEFSLGDNYFTLDSTPITTRVELSQKVATGITANVGMDMLYAPYDVGVRFPPMPVLGEPPAGPFLSRPPLETHDKNAIYRPALYTEFEIVPRSGTRIVPGIRLDYAKDTRSWDLSPRFTARQDLTRAPRTTLKGGIGVFMQPPQPQETNVVFGNPTVVSNRALHYSIGVEREFTRNIELGVETFYKQLDRLVVPGRGNDGRGRVYGLETLLRYKPDARFFGWLAYTLSRSERQDYPGAPVTLAPFDQTHILTVLGSYRLGRGWEFGSTFRLVSGNRYTPQTYGFYDENAGVVLPQLAYPPFGQRLPLYHVLNVRVDKTWRFKAWQLGAYLDVQNAYNQSNVEGISRNYNFTKTTYASGIPFLPSIGLRGEF
jgi:TonB family protein